MISRNIPHLGFIIFAAFMTILVYALLRFQMIDREILALLSCLPLILVPLAIVIGIRFNRSRLVLSSGVIGLLIYLFCYAAVGPWFTRGLLLAKFVAPLFLGILVWKRERGLLTSPGISWTVGTIFLCSVPVILWLMEPALFTELMGPVGEFLKSNSSWIFMASLGVGSLSCFTAYLVRHGVMEVTLFFVTIANYLALNVSQNDDYSAVIIFSFALVLSLAGLLELSHHLAFKDELTGLPGRRALMEDLAKLGHNYSLAMSDIDHFKKFNDTYGHETGDAVLKKVAQQLNMVGGGGKVYRYGGEEFTIVFDGLKSHEAAKHLDVVRQAMEDNHLTVVKPAKGKTAARECEVRITISIGVAEPDKKMNSPILVMKGADKALYMAKKNGRNRVIDLLGPVVTDPNRKSTKSTTTKKTTKDSAASKEKPSKEAKGKKK